MACCSLARCLLHVGGPAIYWTGVKYIILQYAGYERAPPPVSGRGGRTVRCTAVLTRRRRLSVSMVAMRLVCRMSIFRRVVEGHDMTVAKTTLPLWLALWHPVQQEGVLHRSQKKKKKEKTEFVSNFKYDVDDPAETDPVDPLLNPAPQHIHTHPNGCLMNSGASPLLPVRHISAPAQGAKRPVLGAACSFDAANRFFPPPVGLYRQG